MRLIEPHAVFSSASSKVAAILGSMIVVAIIIPVPFFEGSGLKRRTGQT